jgi:hypothetical protein
MLTKAEKRQLKFAAKNGQNMGEVDDIQGFAQMRVADSKKTHNTPKTMAGYLENEYSQKEMKQFRMKQGDYKNIETVQDQQF